MVSRRSAAFVQDIDFKLSSALLLTTALAAVVLAPLAVQAQVAPTQVAQAQPLAQPRIRFAIAAQPLDSALNQFGRAAGLQITTAGTATAGLQSPGVTGEFTAREALTRLLANTGLTYSFTDAQTVALVPAPRGGDAAVLPTISVGGVQPSLDAGRTEGTHSYAGSQVTVGSKTPATIREVPQSVSVITRQRIEDRNYTTVEQAVAQTTGMRRQVVEQERSYLYSRGYVATAQVDGLTLDGGSGIVPNAFDLGIYDRVEILRGPAGLFQGTGEPTGVVNLIRKRPTEQFSYGGAAQLGSWDFYRAEGDVSGPLFGGDRVRGRLVAVAQDRNFFVDKTDETKMLGYGIIEMDLTEATTFTWGGAYQDQQAKPFFGLPAFSTGQMLGIPRSTFIGADWNTQDAVATQAFSELQHRFDNGAVAQLSAQLLDRSHFVNYARAQGAVDPAVGTTNLTGVKQDLELENLNLDGHVSSPVNAFGLEHKIVAGMDYRMYDDTRKSRTTNNLATTSVFAPTTAIPSLAEGYTSQTRTQHEQFGLYGQARIKLLEPVTAVLGGRGTWWNGTVTNLVTGRNTADASIDAEFTPFAGLIYDVNDNVSLYGAYSEIFQPQTNATVNGTMLPPRTGTQYEIGAKAEFLNKKLIAHAAAFHIRDKNRATEDLANAGQSFSVASGEAQSQGVEVEISGKPYPGWDIVAGYAFTHTLYLSDNWSGTTGTAFNPMTPKHVFNIWTKYTFDGGPLDRFSVGAGAKAVNSHYERSGTQVSQEGYVLVDAQVGYRLTDTVSASLSVNNVFDKVYYERLMSPTFLNFYGEPRSVWFTVRKTF